MNLLPQEQAGAGLRGFLARHPRLFVLTGAGLSTASGIPDYRDRDGRWKTAQPMQFREFADSQAARQRYWTRSMAGWPHFSTARPNAAHLALARLEARGHIAQLVTQNVDCLHQQAGSQQVIDLHGRLDQIQCLGCRQISARSAFQQRLHAANPDWDIQRGRTAPDGDMALDGISFESFKVPDCEHCGGALKPAVVFFGETVPQDKVTAARKALEQADAMLVIGSSLMLWSAFRFCRYAAETGKAIAAINLGRTRADELLALKVEDDCGRVLEELAG